MHIEDLIRLYKSTDIKELDRFFIEEGFSLVSVHRQDNQGKEVEAGEEIHTTYGWRPDTNNNLNQFNSIHYSSWREDYLINLFSMEVRDGNIFEQLISEIRSRKDFTRRYGKKETRIQTSFFNREKEMKFVFIDHITINLSEPDSHFYTLFIQYKPGSFKS